MSVTRLSGKQITSELEIAFSFLKGERVVAITGSLGKSTTVSLLGVGAQSFAPESFYGGNLGVPLADYVRELLSEKRGRAPWVILELSSYQLENFKNLSAENSAITYFTPNHLERYASLDDYYKIKWSLSGKTKRTVILNEMSKDLLDYSLRQKSNSGFRKTSRKDPSLKKYSLSTAKILGAHNQDNLAVATQVALACGWPESSIEAMKNFMGLAHRLENLGERKDIRFINDSKSTTMESVRQAVSSVIDNTKGSLILLLGGKDKSLPWEELRSLSSYKNLKCVFFGEYAKKAKEKTKLEGPDFATLKEALKAVKKLAQAHDAVLLSPGGTSLDEFKSFEERGDLFKNEISKLW